MEGMTEGTGVVRRWPQPTWGELLLRGLIKRCPRCGGRRIYDGWFRMKDRCPTCGIRFEREPGFFVGAYLVNFAIAIVLLFIECMAFVAWKATHPDAGVTVAAVTGVIIAVVAPVLFYPFSRTLWSALDMGGTPIEPKEEAEAAAFLAGEPIPVDVPTPAAADPGTGPAAEG